MARPIQHELQRRRRTPRCVTTVTLASLLFITVVHSTFSAPSSPTKPSSGSGKPVSPALFINSDPIGAVVVLDRKTLPSRTPLLLRDVAAGKHRIAIARKGYRPYLGTLEASAEKPTSFSVALEPEYFDPIFSGGRSVLIDGKTANVAKEQYRLPAGEYRVSSRPRVISVEPIFPDRQIMRVVDIAAGGLLTATAITVGEAIFNPINTSNQNGSNALDPYIPVWILTGIAVISDLSLHIQKSRYLKAYAATAVPLANTSQDAARLYREGQTRLAAGNLAEAAGYYIQIIRNASDSLYYPRALYQLAKIDAIEGDNLLATAELRVILEKYPMADLYDRTCKSLADISYRDGDYRTAIDYLDKMVFLDPLYPRSQIAEYRATIEKKLSQGAGS